MWPRRSRSNLGRPLEATVAQINSTLAALPGGGATKIWRQETLECLLKDLREFGPQQVNYFKNNDAPTTYKTENAIALTLDQAGNNLSLIQRIIAERTSPTPEQKETLEVADRLIARSLAQAQNTGLIDAKDVLVPLAYLQKDPTARVIHYSRVALVGAPLTAVPFKGKGEMFRPLLRDVLAIPHEAGHHVFALGKTLKADPQSHLRLPLGKLQS